MNALTLRSIPLPAISRARPVEVVAEVVDADLEHRPERGVTIRVELAPARETAPLPETAPRALPPLTFEASGVDHLPLTAARSNRSRAAHAYAAHAVDAVAPPPSPGIVIRLRA